jgi:hypothetical protein
MCEKTFSIAATETTHGVKHHASLAEYQARLAEYEAAM